jgi:hypothetical protein
MLLKPEKIRFPPEKLSSQELSRLAPDGTPCTCETRGLLQRSSVIAASRRYVGKETDRRWEQGEDLSLVEFKAVEYQGSKQVEASDEIKQEILKDRNSQSRARNEGEPSHD